MTIDTQQIIRSIINAEDLLSRQAKESTPAFVPVITVSRQCGSQGEAIAEKLAERLDIPYYNKQLVEKIAASANVEPELFEQLEQSIRNIKPSWMESLFTQRPWLQAKYSDKLVEVLLGISRVGGVILGRGAGFVLGQASCFRLRIIGSATIREERYMGYHQVDRKEAEKCVREVDDERENFVKVLFQQDINRPEGYDLIVNSDRIEVDAIVELVLSGIHAMSCNTPSN